MLPSLLLSLSYLMLSWSSYRRTNNRAPRVRYPVHVTEFAKSFDASWDSLSPWNAEGAEVDLATIHTKPDCSSASHDSAQRVHAIDAQSVQKHFVLSFVMCCALSVLSVQEFVEK